MGDPPQVILAPNQKTAPARVGVLRSQAPLTIAFGMKPAEPQKARLGDPAPRQPIRHSERPVTKAAAPLCWRQNSVRGPQCRSSDAQPYRHRPDAELPHRRCLSIKQMRMARSPRAQPQASNTAHGPNVDDHVTSSAASLSCIALTLGSSETILRDPRGFHSTAPRAGAKPAVTRQG